MPVNTTFVKTTLEQCLERQVEIRRLLDFLESVIDGPSKRSFVDFVERWSSTLHKGPRKMMIICYKGTWPPICLCEKEIRKQAKWEDFARTYDSSFVGCTVDSQSSLEYQPLNFTELLKLSFWENLYEKFGNQIVAHIFDKCAILYEVDESLYLLVGNPKGSIYKKIASGQRRNGKTATKASIKTQIESKSNNPYQSNSGADVEVGKENSGSLTTCLNGQKKVHGKKTGNLKRSRGLSTSENQEAMMPEKKKRKMDVRKDTGAESKVNVNRWILPKPEVLQDIIKIRNSIRKSCNLSTNDVIPSSNLLNYVWIQQDEDFLAKDKSFVLKQLCKCSAYSPKLPKKWKGLKLPDNLSSIADKNGEIVVHVYIISETLAKKLQIRIKPKGRHRKKKSLPDEQTTFNNSKPENSKVLSTLSEEILANIQNRPARTTNSNVQAAVEEEAIKGGNIVPYTFNSNLPIAPCLYNKSCWSKWPQSHSLLKAGKPLHLQNKIGVIQTVIDDVLKQNTCLNAAYEHLINSFTWNASDLSHPMSKIVLDIVQMHYKITDVHKLFKNCVSYWRVKYYRKQVKKSKAKISKSVEPELIDLTSSIPDMQMPPEPDMNDLAHSSTQKTHYTITDSYSSAPTPSSIQVAVRSPMNGTVPAISSTNAEKYMKANRKKSTSKCSQRSKHNLQRKDSGNSCSNKFFSSLKQPIPHNCVMQTLKQIFCIMKVDKLLGSKRNVRGFFKFVRKALILGGTKSSLHLSELMAMIHPGDIPIVLATNCKLAVEIFTAKLVTWLFNDYVLVLLKTCCYITECSFSRMHLTFYLRESWTSAYYRMRSHLIKKRALEFLGNKETRPNAVIRYVPKQNHSLRSLLVMKKSGWSLSKDDSKQLNIYLHYVDAKINKSRMHLPTTIQREWRKFYLKWKANGSPKLFYLRMDIRDAYPSVCLKKMNEILMNSSGGSMSKMVMKRYVLIGGSGIKRFRDSILDGSNRENWYSGIHVRPCIVMDLNHDKAINVWKMLKHIGSIINTTNVVQVGKKPYEFHYGLPQGWGQSPILCNIYYGYIDSSLYIPYLKESSGCLFLRVVDDYLFVTPKSSDVLDLMQLMRIGCEKYGIVLNDEKAENNIGSEKIDGVVRNNSCERVTFCGWNFCMRCGHVTRDFKKYIGQDFCSTITFSIPSNVSSPDQFLRLRGTVIVPARVKPILLDPVVNCYKRILLTVFEASIILGFRFYAICRVVYPNLNALKENERVEVILSCINLCCSRLANYVVRNSEHSGPPFGSQEKASCSDTCCGGENTAKGGVVKDEFLSINALMFTSFHGFRMKLLNHSGVFQKVLPRLNRSMSKLREKLSDELCDSILNIVGSKMPECFSDILI